MTSPSLLVAYNPVPTAGRVAHHRSTRVRLAVQALVIVAIAFLTLALTRDSFDLSTLMWMLGSWVVLFAVLFLVQTLRLRSASKALLGIGEGTALRLDRSGIALRRQLRQGDGSFDDVTGVQVEGAPAAEHLDLVSWDDLDRFAVQGTGLGEGPALVVTDRAGHRWQVPVSWLDERPGAIDSAALAWSGGRRRLDVTGLDSF